MARVHQGVYLSQWSQQQEGFYREHEKDPIQDTGELWTASLIGFSWLRIHQLWTKRNDEMHKVVGNRGSARAKSEVKSHTRALHEQAAHQQPTKGLLAWVVQVTPSVKVGLL
jgi:hypothetical protein